ncbi:hypothetical protein ACNF49_02725 [Actinomadura sp. ATCC 39365]
MTTHTTDTYTPNAHPSDSRGTATRTAPRLAGSPPRSVQLAANWMGVQCCIGILALAFLLPMAGAYGPIPGAVLVWAGVTFAFYILIGVLAAKLSAGRRWVRRTALTVEILMLGSGALSLFTGPNIGTVVALAIATVITCYLSTRETAEYFAS